MHLAEKTSVADTFHTVSHSWSQEPVKCWPYVGKYTLLLPRLLLPVLVILNGCLDKKDARQIHCSSQFISFFISFLKVLILNSISRFNFTVSIYLKEQKSNKISQFQHLTFFLCTILFIWLTSCTALHLLEYSLYLNFVNWYINSQNTFVYYSSFINVKQGRIALFLAPLYSFFLCKSH